MVHILEGFSTMTIATWGGKQEEDEVHVLVNIIIDWSLVVVYIDLFQALSPLVVSLIFIGILKCLRLC